MDALVDPLQRVFGSELEARDDRSGFDFFSVRGQLEDLAAAPVRVPTRNAEGELGGVEVRRVGRDEEPLEEIGGIVRGPRWDGEQQNQNAAKAGCQS